MLWKDFKVVDMFQFFLEFRFWRLVVVPAIPIRVVGGCLWLFKNNTGKYHGVCFQTSNNHLWKKQHTTTKNVNVAAALMKLIFTSNWSIYLSIVIHFIFKSSNAILMVGFVLTNFLMQMLKYLIHAKYMQKIHHLQDQWKKR